MGLMYKKLRVQSYQGKRVLSVRVSSKQKHRPTYIVSDITHSPLNVLFSSIRPIALNYRTSRRLRRYPCAKLEWYWYNSLCIVCKIDGRSREAWRICIPVESFKLDNFFAIASLHAMFCEISKLAAHIDICHFLLNLSNSMIFRYSSTWYLFYVNNIEYMPILDYKSKTFYFICQYYNFVAVAIK